MENLKIFLYVEYGYVLNELFSTYTVENVLDLKNIVAEMRFPGAMRYLWWYRVRKVVLMSK